MRLPGRVRSALTLTRFQAIIGITAGVLSIAVTGWGILFASRPAVTSGEVVTIVQEARTEKPVAGATVEILTFRDALVMTLVTKNGQARQTLKEGAYRLRASHPKFLTEVRQIQVLAGQSQEIRLRLAPRAVEKASPFDKAGEAIKKLFR
ncbi:MAG: carboxypeptidase regulatory-like domain-containing protein [Candidatus Rokubacteria bacterium]|nr:carboxypeptidase regulatory-like domain-containing protein [Candidatus Rokubacteria bacterium]